MRVRPVAAAFCAALLLPGCGGDDSPDPEAAYLEDVRGELAQLLDEDAPDYTDDELVAFGDRACDNLEDVDDGAALRQMIEAASVGSSDAETLQIAQATVLVTSAARHLCPDQGERLGLLDGSASA